MGNYKYLWRMLIVLVLVFAISNFRTTAQAAPAAEFYLAVDTTDDDLSLSACNDGIPDDCSLRGAIQYANTHDAASTYYVLLGIGTYTLISTGAGDDANGTGDLDLIGRTILMFGAGPSQTIIDGNNTDRVLDILSGNVTIEHLKITHGSAAGGGGGGMLIRDHAIVSMDDILVESNVVLGDNPYADVGGGINSMGRISLTNSTLIGNSACIGGGYYDGDSPAWLQTVNFLSNTANSDPNCGAGGGVAISSMSESAWFNQILVSGNNAVNGGGIASFGNVEAYIIDSTIENNTAGQGGGLYSYGHTTLNRVTISGNHAPDSGNFGGGVQNRMNLTLINVTISGNDAYNAGGFDAVNGSSASFNHCTIVDNTSPNYGQDVYLSFGATTSFHNTIISRSLPGDTACFMDDPRVTITDLGYNLSSDHSCGFSTSAPFYDLIDVPPSLVLLTLGDYGGPTETIALVAHGPAVDTADPNTSLTRDQRGYFRPMFGRSDIGSFEWDSVQVNLFFWLPLLIKQ